MSADYNSFVFQEIRRIGRAWIDHNPGDHTPEVLFEKIGEMSWRRLMDGKSERQILTEIGVNPDDYLPSEPTPAPIPPPPPSADLAMWPRVGLSIASLITDRRQNIADVIRIYQDAGVQLTRVNLLTALWTPEHTVLPFERAPGSQQWDLYRWNAEFFERTHQLVEGMNAAGIVCILTFLELYSWSRRKPGPQQNGTPWRNNVNGVFWAPEDTTLTILLPDQWCREFIKKVVPFLRLSVNLFEVGNELPEKPLHRRVRDVVRAVQPHAYVSVNRQEDTPGQYVNMKIGKDFDFISFHGRLLKKPSDWKREYPDEPVYQTFDEFFAKCPHDATRIIFSSDGARASDDPVNTYEWDALRDFFREAIHRGYSVEHQSRAKMTPAPNGHMIEVDWFRSLRS